MTDRPTKLRSFSTSTPVACPLCVVHRTDRGRREVGPGVIEAFYAGLETVRLDEFDYLCKLDVDLNLPLATSSC
jgi:hypothetical protein